MRRHYLLSEIPTNYWTLEEGDFWGDPEALDEMKGYLNAWDNYKWLGFGLEFYSPRQGTGKTMLAIIVGKRLIKMEEKVLFMSFRDAVKLYDLPIEIREEKVTRLRSTPVLILDDVVPAISDAQRDYYAVELEDLMRARTNGSCVTIMTTNLTPKELEDQYSRAFSLLQAKQKRVFVQGTDARINGEKMLHDLELVANGEARPIQ